MARSPSLMLPTESSLAAAILNEQRTYSGTMSVQGLVVVSMLSLVFAGFGFTILRSGRRALLEGRPTRSSFHQLVGGSGMLLVAGYGVARVIVTMVRQQTRQPKLVSGS